jgi:hypothetical protein
MPEGELHTGSVVAATALAQHGAADIDPRQVGADTAVAIGVADVPSRQHGACVGFTDSAAWKQSRRRAIANPARAFGRRMSSCPVQGARSAERGAGIDHARQFFIAWVDPLTSETMEVLDPATERPIAAIVLAGEKDVDRAVTAARAAFASFASTTKESAPGCSSASPRTPAAGGLALDWRRHLELRLAGLQPTGA